MQRIASTSSTAPTVLGVLVALSLDRVASVISFMPLLLLLLLLLFSPFSRVLGFLQTFKVSSKCPQLSCNLYKLILRHISIEQTKLFDTPSPHYQNRHINKTVQTSIIFMFKNIYLSKIVDSHKNTVFITKNSTAIYWQDSNSFQYIHK